MFSIQSTLSTLGTQLAKLMLSGQNWLKHVETGQEIQTSPDYKAALGVCKTFSRLRIAP
jgi:hypothetical protein